MMNRALHWMLPGGAKEYSGKGAQERALQFAVAAQLPVWAQEKKIDGGSRLTRVFLVACVDQFFDTFHATDAKHRAFYEVIPENRPVKFAVDLDGKSHEDGQCVEYLVKALQQGMHKVFGRTRCIIMDSSNPGAGKYSKHMVWPDVVIADWKTDGRALYDELYAQLDHSKLRDGVFDRIIYSNRRNWRLPGATKLDKDQPLVFVGEHENFDARFVDALVATFPEGIDPVPLDIPRSSSADRNPSTTGQATTSFREDCVIDTVYDGSIPCPHIGRPHKSNGLKVIHDLSTGRKSLQCLDPACPVVPTGYTRMSAEEVRHVERRLIRQQMPECEIRFDDSRFVPATAVDASLNAKKTLFIRSGKGTGKTHAIMNALPPGARVLVLTSGIEVGRELPRKYATAYYKRYTGQDLVAEQRVTITIESLHRLERSLMTKALMFDIIILDESETLLGRLPGDTFTTRRTGCLKILQALIKQATLVICADAELGPMTFDFVAALRSGDESTLHAYVSQYQGAHQTVFRVYDDETRCWEVLIEQLRRNAAAETREPIVVVTIYVDAVQQVEQLVARHDPGSRFLGLTRKLVDGEDPAGRDALKDVNKGWCQRDVVAYSPVVGPAIDFNPRLTSHTFITCL